MKSTPNISTPPLHSTYWYRIAEIRPALRSHVRICRHTYRGTIWYILQDGAANRQHRFNRTTYVIISLMNGRRTMREIWHKAAGLLGDDMVSQDEIIRLLSRLHEADILITDVMPDVLELSRREERRPSRWQRRLMNPLALRFPLVDPDRLLVRGLPLVKPLAGRAGVLLWLVVVVPALILAALHWPELSTGAADRLLTPENLLLLWFAFPFVKLLHELGHAFAVRLRGGEVHEMGIVLMALTPVPYVDCSASAAFPEKRWRMKVAAAGMAVELFVAALALYLWLAVEPGQVRKLAFNVMMIGGVSTLLANGNPLLRFDGYYVLADLLEIPNLARRSGKYLGYLLQRYLFGIEHAVSPVTARGEEGWFVVYGIASFCYRLFIMMALALWIGGKFFGAGIVLAAWAIATQLVFPAVHAVSEFFASIAGRRRRTRILAATTAITAVLGVMLFAVPLPFSTRTQGVVVVPEDSRVLAAADCFVSEIVVPDGTVVRPGDPLIVCEDPSLEAEAGVLTAGLAGAEARYLALPMELRVQREILKKELGSAEASLARVREKMNGLTVNSPGEGRFILPEGEGLRGRFIRQGELLGYIMGSAAPTVVVAVEQADIALVREGSRAVELRLASGLARPLAATIVREVPAASDILPSPVLGTMGGGRIPVDPADPRGVQAAVKIFQIEMRLPVRHAPIRIGERVYARIDHGWETLAQQGYRRMRQLFLGRFNNG